MHHCLELLSDEEARVRLAACECVQALAAHVASATTLQQLAGIIDRSLVRSHPQKACCATLYQRLRSFVTLSLGRGVGFHRYSPSSDIGVCAG